MYRLAHAKRWGLAPDVHPCALRLRSAPLPTRVPHTRRDHPLSQAASAQRDPSQLEGTERMDRAARNTRTYIVVTQPSAGRAARERAHVGRSVHSLAAERVS